MQSAYYQVMANYSVPEVRCFVGLQITRRDTHALVRSQLLHRYQQVVTDLKLTVDSH
jgi:hypothetical protein